jgi:hypothetical protein
MQRYEIGNKFFRPLNRQIKAALGILRDHDAQIQDWVVGVSLKLPTFRFGY